MIIDLKRSVKLVRCEPKLWMILSGTLASLNSVGLAVIKTVCSFTGFEFLIDLMISDKKKNFFEGGVLKKIIL